MSPIVLYSPIQPGPSDTNCPLTVFSRRGSVRLHHTQVLPGAAKVVHFAAGKEAHRGRCCNPTVGRGRAETSRISGISRKPRRKSQGNLQVQYVMDRLYYLTDLSKRRLAGFLFAAPFHTVDVFITWYAASLMRIR